MIARPLGIVPAPPVRHRTKRRGASRDAASRLPRTTHRMRCSEVLSGTSHTDLDLETSGITASLWSCPAHGDRGGDIYSFSVCHHDELTRIVIADVVGHGPAVNHVSEWLRRAMHERMNSLAGHEVLDRLNELACDYGPEAITTALIITYYRSAGILYAAHAGHPPAMASLASAVGDWRPVAPGTRGLLLGASHGHRYVQDELAVHPGDRLLLYTDGIPEARDRSGRFFGYPRLLESIGGAGDTTMRGLRNRVVCAVRSFAPERTEPDDATVVAIELR